MPRLEARVDRLESDLAQLRTLASLSTADAALLRCHVNLVHDRVIAVADRLENGIREARRAPGEPSKQLTSLRGELGGITGLLENILSRLPPAAAP